MFQRIHLSALLSLAVLCVKGELSVSTGISRLTSISTPPAGEVFRECACLCAFVCACMCVPKYIPPLGLGSQPAGQYITPDIINVQFGGERKWNVPLPANMLRPVGPLQSD